MLYATATISKTCASINILTFAVIHSSWGASDMETQVYCVFIESLTEKREKGSQSEDPWVVSIPPFPRLYTTLHCTSLILHNITSDHEQQVVVITAVLFSPQSDCPIVHAYYVEWRLGWPLKHVWAASTRDRPGCDGVMLCTGTVQVYTTNFQRSSSPALLTSGPECVLCSLSALAGLRSRTHCR